MKHLYYFLMAIMTLIQGVNAHEIVTGTTFFDGQFLFTAEQRLNGIIYFTGEDANGEEMELTIEEVAEGCDNEYRLIPSRQADDEPYGTEWGAKVLHIVEGDIEFLAVYKGSVVVNTLVSNTRSLEFCTDMTEPIDTKSVSEILYNQFTFSCMNDEQLNNVFAELDELPELSLIEMVNYDMLRSALGKVAIYDDGIDIVQAMVGCDCEEESRARD